MRGLLFNEDGSLKGSFINALITFVYLVLIVTGIFNDFVRDGILKLQDMMKWFFATSFGVWTLKKSVEIIVEGKSSKIQSE
jgi:hypothetical protein